MPTTKNFAVSYTDATTLPSYGYRETAEHGTMEVVRPCWVSWRDLRNFYRGMLGFTDITPKTVFYPPEPHPRHRNLYATRCDMHSPAGVPSLDAGRKDFVTMDSAGSVVVGPVATDTSRCLVDVTYSYLPYSVPSAPALTTGLYGWSPSGLTEVLNYYVERNANFTVQNLSLDGQTFKWATDGQAITNAAAAVKIMPSMQLHYKHHRVHRIPYAAIEANLGKVNDSTFDVNLQVGAGAVQRIGNFAAETLLFCGVDFERQNTLDPADDSEGPFGFTWNITYQFAYQWQTWNKIFRKLRAATSVDNSATTNTRQDPFERVVADYPTNAFGIYRTYDFHNFFYSLTN